MQMSTLSLFTILLVVALGASFIFRTLRLPTLLGYILVGVILGPHLLNWLQDQDFMHAIAEFGIVFLMFTIGLEFSLRKLISMRAVMLGYGGLQVLLSASMTFGIALWLDMSIGASIIVGGIVAMSSTAIVLKQLDEQSELDKPHGVNALGILLLQDLAVIPFLVILPKLASVQATSVGTDLGLSLLKSAILVLQLSSLGKVSLFL